MICSLRFHPKDGLQSDIRVDFEVCPVVGDTIELLLGTSSDFTFPDRSVANVPHFRWLRVTHRLHRPYGGFVMLYVTETKEL